MGDAPSQMAQALIPADQNLSSEGMPSRLAVAPVAMMRECARTVVSVPRTTNGRVERSTDSTSSTTVREPYGWRRESKR